MSTITIGNIQASIAEGFECIMSASHSYEYKTNADIEGFMKITFPSLDNEIVIDGKHLNVELSHQNDITSITIRSRENHEARSADVCIHISSNLAPNKNFVINRYNPDKVELIRPNGKSHHELKAENYSVIIPAGVATARFEHLRAA